jgi:V-type ATPase 116kDa subunit family.
MAIVKMSKFTLFVLENEREDLLQEMQRFKYVHFADLNEEDSFRTVDLMNFDFSRDLEKIRGQLDKVSYCIDVLMSYKTKENLIQVLKSGVPAFDFSELEQRASHIDYETLYQEIKKLSDRKEQLRQSLADLHTKKNSVKPWVNLDFPISGMYSLKRCHVLTGSISKNWISPLEKELKDFRLTHWNRISEDKDKVYLLILIHPTDFQSVAERLKMFGFTEIRLTGEGTPAHEIAQLEQLSGKYEEDIREIENRLREKSNDLLDLQLVYEYLRNLQLRYSVANKFKRTDRVAILSGYIPAEKSQQFLKLVHDRLGNHYYLELAEAEKDDPNVPILLENSTFTKSFESLTEMYALPKYDELDPTAVFSFFYVFFFGMMVADMGYGMLMLIATVVALKFLKLRQSQRPFIRFFFYLSFSTIFWGAIYGSIFGGMIPIPALIDPAKDYNLLLVLSILFGIIHVYVALGVKAYMLIRDGEYLASLFDVGFWYMALTGAIIYLVCMFTDSLPFLKNPALAVMIVGMAGIVLTGGREAKTFGGKLAGGLYSLYGISSYVGDFVSYSRLMALGLSGGFIATAINMMMDMLFHKGWIGIVFGIVVFLAGQAFNIFLSLLGAYVHTLRLTYVEFFGKFYEGGGKAFQLFQSRPKYIELK